MQGASGGDAQTTHIAVLLDEMMAEEDVERGAYVPDIPGRDHAEPADDGTGHILVEVRYCSHSLVDLGGSPREASSFEPLAVLLHMYLV